jgi:hypothetical protein
MTNTFKTTLLLTALTLLLMFVGRHFDGEHGMVLALVFAGVTNFVAYFFSDKIALATCRARPATPENLPGVYRIVERLTQKAGLPMPKIYVIPSESPNAFATGRNPRHASVAVTQGILGLLNDEKLEGVLAHELGHVNKPRHPHQFGSGHDRRCRYHGCQHGALGHDVRWARKRPGPTALRWHRSARDADPRTYRGNSDSDGRLAIAGIPSRRHWRPSHRRSVRLSQRFN